MGRGGSFKPGRSLNVSAVKRGAHSKGAHLGRSAVSDNYGNAAWLRDELFEGLDAWIELQQNTFYFTF